MQSWFCYDLRVQNQWFDLMLIKSFSNHSPDPNLLCKVGRMHSETSQIKEKRSQPHFKCLFFHILNWFEKDLISSNQISDWEWQISNLFCYDWEFLPFKSNHCYEWDCRSVKSELIPISAKIKFFCYLSNYLIYIIIW